MASAPLRLLTLRRSCENELLVLVLFFDLLFPYGVGLHLADSLLDECDLLVIDRAIVLVLEDDGGKVFLVDTRLFHIYDYKVIRGARVEQGRQVLDQVLVRVCHVLGAKHVAKERFEFGNFQEELVDEGSR